MQGVPSAILAASLIAILASCPGGEVREENESPDVAVCLEGEPFLASGSLPVEGSATGDAEEISALRWEAHDGCERLVIDLAAAEDRAASAAGEVQAELLRELGVLRVSLRGVGRVAQSATEATFDGPLARRAYAAWSPQGRWTFVDIHLGDAAEAHVMLLQDPARVVVDLRGGGGPVPSLAEVSQRVVVLQPRSAEASYPLEVSGYARTFEANVVARLEQDGAEVYEDFTTATAWVDAWGHYRFTIPSGPRGRVTLHVGEHSARDGGWEGVAIPLTMR
jgi:hypothetical protein